jgi:polysaccharide deacetylase family protein (PEP-CTERM system associated)
MAEEGIRYDSSIFPIRHDRYGIPDAKPTIHTINTTAGDILEFPLSVAKLSGVSVPASGGGYFRLYPYRLTRWLVSQINSSGRPLMFYLHPWEIDPEQPLVHGVPPIARLRHRVNLASTEVRLERLLAEFRFDSMASVLQSQARADVGSLVR